jgi:hypothetical protein
MNLIKLFKNSHQLSISRLFSEIYRNVHTKDVSRQQLYPLAPSLHLPCLPQITEDRGHIRGNELQNL